MKIVVQTPLKHEEVRVLLENLERENVKYTFTGKRGINLEFECDGADGEKACAIAKEEIKRTEWGKVLYFSVRLA